MPRPRGDVPYFKTRANRNGTVRNYWIRPGHEPRKLEPDVDAAKKEAKRLNRQADLGVLPKQPPKLKGRPRAETLAWYLDHYESSDEFRALAKQTKANYRSAMRDITATFPTQLIRRFKKKFIKDYLKTIDSIGMRRIAKTVLLNVFEMALDDEVIDRNPADNVTGGSVEPRRQIWSLEQEDAFLEACSVLDEVNRGNERYVGRADAMRRSFLLLSHTGQRVVDVLTMRRRQFDGEYIDVKQQKTKALVAIFAGALGIYLRDWGLPEPEKANADLPIVEVPCQETPWAYKQWNMAFREVKKAAGLPADLQARDLRRTAVTRLYEAGCSEGLIASITGHDIETCRRIIDTYYVRNREHSKQAITRLDEWRAKKRAAMAA